MDKNEKKQLIEIDICDLFITPAIKDAGWDKLQQIRRGLALPSGQLLFTNSL